MKKVEYTFINHNSEDNPFDTNLITLQSNAITLEEILEDFRCFLLASGFTINGELYIGNENEEN